MTAAGNLQKESCFITLPPSYTKTEAMLSTITVDREILFFSTDYTYVVTKLLQTTKGDMNMKATKKQYKVISLPNNVQAIEDLYNEQSADGWVLCHQNDYNATFCRESDDN